MRHRLSRRKLSRPTAHRTLLLRNLVSDVFRYGSIQTTEPKAKEVKRVTEKIITRAKSGTLHDRRQVLSLITDHKLVKKVFDEVGPKYESRNGGYTRIIKLGNRKGDAAAMAMIELMP